MKKNAKKLISLALAISLTLGVLLGATAGLGGFTVYGAASSTYKNELWMLVDYDFALVRGVKTEYGVSPFAYEGGTACLPLKVTSAYMGASYVLNGDSLTVTLSGGAKAELTVGSLSWTKGGTAQTDLLIAPMVVDGEVYLSNLATNAVLGTKSFWNSDIGLAVLSTNKMSYSKGYSSLQTQIDTLGALLFDRPNAATIKSDLESYSGYGTHPRLLVDQDRFDTLRYYYQNRTEDATFSQWIADFTTKGMTVFNNYFNYEYGAVRWRSTEYINGLRQPYYLYDEQGNRLVGVKEYDYTHPDGAVEHLVCDGSGLGDGYDYGGRSNVSKFTVNLKYLAFTWQMTGEQKYADAFYLYARELGKWEHWGEGHFLNCADGAVEFALGLDWIYHAFDNEPAKRDELAKILYDQGLMKGYYSIKDDASKLCISKVAGSTAYRITNRTNNWQTVCGSGMIISALYLADYEEYRENSYFVTETLLGTLEKCLMQYAPDGSYIESPGYWAYGTNTYFLMLASLESALGTDYGYYDTVGLQDSCYYVMHITDSEFLSWGFHDGGRANIDRSSFFLASRAYNDPQLAAMRNYMLERGDAAKILDILYYDPSLAGDVDALEIMALDRLHKGIETVTMRSSWESGALFTGLHTGANQVAHGDIDCGNYFLSMGGIVWVGDPGTEDYNVGNYFNSTYRYYYYRKSLESHNTILIRSDASNLKHGQIYNKQTQTYAQITDYYTDENGAYAIADMKAQYGSTCSSAKRGLLLTNSRSTVVVQDEISFSSPTDLTWITALKYIKGLSEDGRTATAVTYDKDGKRIELRATLLSDDKDLRFEYVRGGETILPTTVTKSNSGNERASESELRLVINKDDCTEFNVSVVYEIIGHEDEVVGYTPVAMSEWTTCTDEWVKDANSWIEYPSSVAPPKYTLSYFKMANRDLEEAESLADMGKILMRTMIYLTDYDQSNKQIAAEVEKYLAYLDEYNAKVKQINDIFKAV